MHNVVLDTVVFVRALINPLSHCGQLVFKHPHQYRLYVSDEVMAEYLEVLNRPVVKDKFRALAGMDMQQVIDTLSLATFVDPAIIEPTSRDPKDDKFLAIVPTVQADYVVSEDQDLLDLGKFETAQILTAEQFLQKLEDELH